MTHKTHKHILEHFKKHDPIIHTYIERIDFEEWLKPHRMQAKEDYFMALCRAIVGQQLSGKAADSIYKRFVTLLPQEKVIPENILSLSEQTFREVGMSWAKARYVRNLAEKVKHKDLHLNSLDALEDSEVIKQLTQVKGIGEWTAEMFLMFTLNRPDVFSHGDLGLRKGFEKVYKRINPTRQHIEKVVIKWSPYRTYGSIALWQSLE